jgi:hypothetical protein
MLLSASNKRAAEIWREQVEAHHQKVMTEALSGDLAAERAGNGARAYRRLSVYEANDRPPRFSRGGPDDPEKNSRAPFSAACRWRMSERRERITAKRKKAKYD